MQHDQEHNQDQLLMIEQVIQRTELAAQRINDQLEQTQRVIQQAVQLTQGIANNENKASLNGSPAQIQMESQKFVTTNISNLWQAYISNSMYVAFNAYALQIIEDAAIRNLFELAQQMANHNVKQLEEIFHQLNFPVPIGFTEADVNLKAPRLFTDHFLLYFLNEMASYGMIGYGLSISISISKEVRQFNKNGMNQSIELYEKSLELMQALKIFDNFPQIPIPATPEFAHQQSFMMSFVKVPPRALDILEISSIYANLKKSILFKALCIAFSQVANSKDVREVMRESVERAEKDIEEFTNVLHHDFLTSPRMWDTDITDSKVPPLSDKLMLTFIAALASLAISNYGTGMSICSRMDLVPMYTSAIAVSGKIGLDISKVLIKNGWLQQPTLAADRKELAQ